MKSDTTRRAELEARLDELRTRLEGIKEDLVVHETKDWEDQATEREDDEVLEGVGEVGMQEIRMTEAALARMDAGEYGFCTVCGERIAEERLDVIPSTPFCSDHAK